MARRTPEAPEAVRARKALQRARERQGGLVETTVKVPAAQRQAIQEIAHRMRLDAGHKD